MGKDFDDRRIKGLYEWQSECLSAWERSGCRGIVSAVTGSGKTFLALSAAACLAKKHPELRIRIVAPTIALANQWRQAVIRMPEFSGIRPGFYGDGIKDDEDCRIMIYVINSARAGAARHIRRDFALGRHVLLICDECHRYKSRENYKIFSFIEEDPGSVPLYSCLGLSATPFNGDSDEKLTRVLGPLVYSYGFDRAVSEETVAPYTVCQIAADFLPEELEEYRELSDRIGLVLTRLFGAHPYLKNLEDKAFFREVKRLAADADMDPDEPAAAFLLLTYQRKKISILAGTRIHCCMKLLESLQGRGRIIIFSERIEQAERIYKLITRRYGSKAGIYHSGMTRNARSRVLSDFREDRTKILVSCRCLDEGIDVPDASVGIVLSASAVPRQRIQRLGRIIRQSSGKDYASLYYIYVRESTDDAAYLAGTSGSCTYDLRYYSREYVFANDLYEYAATHIIRDAGDAGASGEQLRELRRCAGEGLCLPDYLQSSAFLRRHEREAGSVHEKNYYAVMRLISEKFK